eukprot:TRINITY_DN3690_c0_g1_i1.p1 TRINITY_DN3690_c0_g1~~TRINITY_DN3690_c0_g1_i1.p1  ORF type:complete len:115 (+),score=14.46 TRINITY_DN3690_c0_g1_i1:121-465(+)
MGARKPLCGIRSVFQNVEGQRTSPIACSLTFSFQSPPNSSNAAFNTNCKTVSVTSFTSSNSAFRGFTFASSSSKRMSNSFFFALLTHSNHFMPRQVKKVHPTHNNGFQLEDEGT